MVTQKVELEIPVDGKAAYKHSYEKLVAESVTDCATISKSVVSHLPADEQAEAAKAYHFKAFNYGHDLLLRGAERAKGTRAAQGPAKEIAAGIKVLVDNGMAPEAAREFIINQRTAAGKPV